MKLTCASRYALHALGHLANHDGDGPVTSEKMAKATGISGGFLLKVLKSLATAGLLKSMKGPNGGYRLARPAAKVTLLEVLEAVEGPIRGVAPLSQEEGRSEDPLDAKLATICDQTAEALRKQLGKVKLSDLVGKG